MKAELRDPGSVTFTDVERCGKSNIINGKLNAKNIFGALNGVVEFYSDGTSVAVYPAPDDRGPFTDQFVRLNNIDANTALIRACTRAVADTLPPADRQRLLDEDNEIDQSGGFNATDMNAVDMNATDMNATDLPASSAPSEQDEPETSADDVPPGPADEGDNEVDPNATDY